MGTPAGWTAEAYNQATESENRIHADDVAKRYGFRGGLVPGVTVYAYVVHPAVTAWGKDWLERGNARVVLRKPVYDGDRFRVLVTSEDGEYAARLENAEGVVCADGSVAVPENVPAAPQRRGDPWVDYEARPEASREALEDLCQRGMGAVRAAWTAEGSLDRYVRDLDAHPDIVRPDGDACANPAFVLGLANWALAANVCLGPWIHVESDVQNYAAVPQGSHLVVESQVVDLFAKSGHEFVDLDVAAYFDENEAAGAPVMQARHRAIYRLREP